MLKWKYYKRLNKTEDVNPITVTDYTGLFSTSIRRMKVVWDSERLLSGVAWTRFGTQKLHQVGKLVTPSISVFRTVTQHWRQNEGHKKRLVIRWQEISDMQEG